jgi:hypothetical protein
MPEFVVKLILEYPKQMGEDGIQTVTECDYVDHTNSKSLSPLAAATRYQKIQQAMMAALEHTAARFGQARDHRIKNIEFMRIEDAEDFERSIASFADITEEDCAPLEGSDTTL